MSDRLLSRITGRRHHFKLVMRFQPDRQRATMYSERITTIWTLSRRDIIEERVIRKMNADLVAATPRHMLNNGGIDIREVFYLGWFRPKE